MGPILLLFSPLTTFFSRAVRQANFFTMGWAVGGVDAQEFVEVGPRACHDAAVTMTAEQFQGLPVMTPRKGSRHEHSAKSSGANFAP